LCAVLYRQLKAMGNSAIHYEDAPLFLGEGFDMRRCGR
jgi:hypothetical protein